MTKHRHACHESTLAVEPRREYSWRCFATLALTSLQSHWVSELATFQTCLSSYFLTMTSEAADLLGKETTGDRGDQT